MNNQTQLIYTHKLINKSLFILSLHFSWCARSRIMFVMKMYSSTCRIVLSFGSPRFLGPPVNPLLNTFTISFSSEGIVVFFCICISYLIKNSRFYSSKIIKIISYFWNVKLRMWMQFLCTCMCFICASCKNRFAK